MMCRNFIPRPCGLGMRLDVSIHRLYNFCTASPHILWFQEELKLSLSTVMSEFAIKLSSAFDLLVIFLCSRIPTLTLTLTLTPPTNNALLANINMWASQSMSHFPTDPQIFGFVIICVRKVILVQYFVAYISAYERSMLSDILLHISACGRSILSDILLHIYLHTKGQYWLIFCCSSKKNKVW